jgi:Thioesterase-like superfamily
MASAFYDMLAEDRYAATRATVGPWDPRMQHGSPPAALLARVIDRALPRPDARIARLSYDFYGPVPAAELTVAVESVRPGARIDLSRARLATGGRTVLEATAWRIAATPGRAPDVLDPRPVPPLPGPQPQSLFPDVPSFPYGEALEWRFVEGGYDQPGPATVYARPTIPLVDGEALSMLGRLLLMVDSANGISAELPLSRFTFVPIELTVSVVRHPRTEWVGMSARTIIDRDGVGQVRAELFDEESYLGTALQTLFVAAKP